MVRHYRRAAERDGWRPSGAATGRLCFTPAGGDGTTTLEVYFLTEGVLDAEGSTAGPEFGSGEGYRVAVTATADGSAAGCAD